MTAEPRLLIRLGSLGDVVLSTAAASAARERWGDGSVDVLVKAEWASLWDGHPAVRRVWAWPSGERGPSGIRAWAARLRRERFAEAFDLQASPRTRLLLGLAGVSQVHRPERHDVRRRLLVLTRRFGPPPEFRVARAFAEAVLPGSNALPALFPSPTLRAGAAGRIPGPGRLGMVPGARHATKRWPLERFVEVGRRLAGAGRGPVPVFFGPGEEALLDAWREAWPAGGEWTPILEPDLPQVAAYLARLSGVVTGDTGLMHVAAAVGTPVVAIFGPTVRSFGFAPVGPGHRVLAIEGLSCRPCSLHGGPRCPRRHFRCMLEIGADRVVEAALSISDGSPADRSNSLETRNLE